MVWWYVIVWTFFIWKLKLRFESYGRTEILKLKKIQKDKIRKREVIEESQTSWRFFYVACITFWHGVRDFGTWKNRPLFHWEGHDNWHIPWSLVGTTMRTDLIHVDWNSRMRTMRGWVMNGMCGDRFNDCVVLACGSIWDNHNADSNG